MQKEMQVWKELNNIPESSLYIEFPLDFTGKTKDDNSTAFSGLILSAQFILGWIHTLNKINRRPAKITYESLVALFGMSKETVRNAISLLIERGIIECVKRSCYKIKVRYNKKDYIKIDTYLLKHEFEVNGSNKRLARSRILTLALLKRGVLNPNTEGEFVSSQARIGKAINLPRTTAGDCVRELAAGSLIHYEKQSGNDKLKRGCSKFTVNPQILAVRQPDNYSMQSVKSVLEAVKLSADEAHSKLMFDTEYRELIERIDINHSERFKEIRRSGGEETETLIQLEKENANLGKELDNYFTTHKINRNKLFPPGYFFTDIVENSAI